MGTESLIKEEYLLGGGGGGWVWMRRFELNLGMENKQPEEINAVSIKKKKTWMN
jgi:hypothetical protein